MLEFENEESVGRLINKRPEAGFTLAQGFFRALAIVDVRILAVPLDDLSRFIAEGCAADQLSLSQTSNWMRT